MQDKLIIDFPNFSELNYQEASKEIKKILENNRKLILKLLSSGIYTWDSLVHPLEIAQNKLNCYWSTINHIHSVQGGEELRKVYKLILPMVSKYYAELGQNKDLYKAYKKILRNKQELSLNQQQIKYLENEIRDFKLSGVELPKKNRDRFAELQIKLSELSNTFKENVLYATQKWQVLINDQEELEGLPERALIEAKEFAKQNNKKGYLFNLDFPSYIAIIRYATKRELRKRFYQAHSTRASSFSGGEIKYDNSEVIEDILEIRQELAKMLGFESYAEYSIQTKMSSSTTEVLSFLYELLKKSKPQAEIEYQEIANFAKEDGVDDFSPWDIEYYREKYKTKHFNISEQEIREYFPVDQVLIGLFNIVNKLFDLSIQEVQTDIWHEDVKVFAIYDQQELRGHIFCDLFAREGKQGGAWMDECRTRFKISEDEILTPIAYLTCNFTPPISGIKSLLTHNEVTTLFHEFGHCLHHILTKVTVLGVSGINGVSWDAVELPSQLLENWCWNYNALIMCTKHFKNSQKLPKQIFNKLLKTKNYHSAMYMLRQLEFAIFDFKLHMECDPVDRNYVQRILDEVRLGTDLYPVPEYNKFQNSFSHIFAGGYAAGYYSYKWAEVLSCDAFSKFQEDGILNNMVGLSFAENILEKGGSEDISLLFKSFRGREPEIEPLLKNSGIGEVSNIVS
jgi:oligopeptidase A